MDHYPNFAELAKHEREGEDYTLLCRVLDSKVAIIAPHGGGIEPGTIDIADEIAGNDYTFYAFKGIKQKGNTILHLTSNRYDEPIGSRICQNASVVISVHGARDTGHAVFIGGLKQALMQNITQALRRAGFCAVISEAPGLRGINPENICNRCKSGEGVQLEISRGLREKMFEHLDRRSKRKRTSLFYHFVEAIKTTLSDVPQ